LAPLRSITIGLDFKHPRPIPLRSIRSTGQDFMNWDLIGIEQIASNGPLIILAVEPGSMTDEPSSPSRRIPGRRRPEWARWRHCRPQGDRPPDTQLYSERLYSKRKDGQTGHRAVVDPDHETKRLRGDNVLRRWIPNSPLILCASDRHPWIYMTQWCLKVNLHEPIGLTVELPARRISCISPFSLFLARGRP
jgi:hypothetical protein